MPTLYINQQNTVLRVSGNSLIVTTNKGDEENPNKELLSVESHRLEAVLLVGRIHVTADALRFCMQKGIDIAWYSRNGKYLGCSKSPESRASDLHLLQFERLKNESERLNLAKTFILSKIKNSRSLLKSIQKNKKIDGLSLTIKKLLRIQSDIENAESLQSLLGIEGNGAKIYFSVFSQIFTNDIKFLLRQQNPSPDAANALLSFSYVLLGNLIAGIMQGRGLNPCIGCFHEIKANRASLSLDMLEEFRPLIDKFVIRLCNLGIIKNEMFCSDDKKQGGVRLKSEAIRIFFHQWETFLSTPIKEADTKERLPVTKIIERQVNLYVQSLRQEKEYIPFVFEV